MGSIWGDISTLEEISTVQLHQLNFREPSLLLFIAITMLARNRMMFCESKQIFFEGVVLSQVLLWKLGLRHVRSLLKFRKWRNTSAAVTLFSSYCCSFICLLFNTVMMHIPVYNMYKAKSNLVLLFTTFCWQSVLSWICHFSSSLWRYYLLWAPRKRSLTSFMQWVINTEPFCPLVSPCHIKNNNILLLCDLG
jgi:hypothetical protein